jgi:hypothetical protein
MRKIITGIIGAAALVLSLTAATAASASTTATATSTRMFSYEHMRTASTAQEYTYRTYTVATAPTLTQCQADQLLYPRGGTYEGGEIVATTCFYVIDGLYQLMVTVQYGNEEPTILGDTCTGAEDAPQYPECYGMWETSSDNYSEVLVQGSGNHSLTHLTWVPYPSDTRWGWLLDPNGKALAYYSLCKPACTIMYTQENVWWELFRQVTAPTYAGFWHVPLSLDSNNNGTLGYCMHFWGIASAVIYDTNTSSCYSTIPQSDTWAAPYN